jgi:hypothetical protein
MNVFACASAVACVAAAVFWARSYQYDHSQTGESLNIRRSDPLWWVNSYRGKLTLCRQNGKDWGNEFGKVEGLGFKFGGLNGPNGSLWNLAVPYWFVVSASAVPPVIWAWRLRRLKRRRASGLCRRCGYDLRGIAGRCPECGEPLPVPTGFPVA